MIKNIVFDFGGVLLNLDYDRTFSALSEVMGIEMTKDSIPAHIYKIMLGYEKGEINTETFLWNLQKESSKLTPHADKLINAWNAMLLGWNPARFKFLLDLREDYKVYLLSNTNALHLEWVSRDLKKNHAITDFDNQYFDKTFYSHNMRKRKPEQGIYDTVTKALNLDPQHTLFIDDLAENVAAARATGWHSVRHDPKDEIIDTLQSYIDNCT